MALTWYLSLYSIKDGKYFLNDYEQCSSCAMAKHKQTTLKPPYSSQEYVVENTVGSRSSMKRYIIKPRAKYSPANTKKCRDEKMAEHQAQKLLNEMCHLSPNTTEDTMRSIIIKMLVLKQHLTEGQYKVLWLQLHEIPCYIKLLHNYDLENSTSIYI